MNCTPRERGDLCGADDCRTCHHENFDDDGRLMPVCERCGERVKRVNEDEICRKCENKLEEMKQEQAI